LKKPEYIICEAVLASTNLDRQGEKAKKEYLEYLVASMPGTTPLHTGHDLSLPPFWFHH